MDPILVFDGVVGVFGVVQAQPVAVAGEERPDLEAVGVGELGHLLEQLLDLLESRDRGCAIRASEVLPHVDAAGEPPGLRTDQWRGHAGYQGQNRRETIGAIHRVGLAWDPYGAESITRYRAGKP